METRAKQRALWFSWSLTGLIWLLVGPATVPGIDRLPPEWRVIAALALMLIHLFGPGIGTGRGLFRNPTVIRELPQFLNSWAIALALLGTAFTLWQDGPQSSLQAHSLHFHSASFLISYFLQAIYLLEVYQRWARLQALRELNLTRTMATRLKEAQDSQPPLVERTLRHIPNIYIGLLVAAVLCMAAWYLALARIDLGLIQAATILAMASPWMLLIGVPTCFRYALNTAAYQSTLIGNAAIIEMATRINALVFGKRGTLTEGSPRVTDIIPTTGIDEEELLLWAASAEHDSGHPFGQAIVAEAKSQSIPLEPPERFTEMTGRGVECVIDGQPVRLGKPAFFDKSTVPAYLADRLEALAQEGKTPFMCCRGSEYLGIIAVTESVRTDVAAAIESLRGMGLRTIMMTGDDRMMSEGLAERLHIDQVIAEVLAENKGKEINRLRRDGFHVGMVGSYPEDNVSFEESELGITLTRGKGRDLPPTDVVLLEDKLDHVVRFLDICRRTVRIARENRLLSYGYHAAAVLFGAGILVPFGYQPLSPVLGGLISGAAFLISVLNMRRIKSVS